MSVLHDENREKMCTFEGKFDLVVIALNETVSLCCSSVSDGGTVFVCVCVKDDTVSARGLIIVLGTCVCVTLFEWEF